MLTLIHHSNHLRRRPRPARKLFAALCLTALLGCSPMHNSHGFIPDDDTVGKVRPGVHDRDSVTSLLGFPTSTANFNGETWLYMKRESEQIAFFSEKILDRDVLAVRFDEAGVVIAVERYTLADGRTLIPVERTTPTRGRELSVLEQLFGNIGRFSNQGSQ